MKTRIFANPRRLIALLGMSLALLLTSIHPVHAQDCRQVIANYATFTLCRGTLADGSLYGMQVPTSWNGTLVVISTGYTPPVPPGTPVPTLPGFLPSSFPRTWLLGNGYAVATSYAWGGWSVRENLRDQIATLDIFATLFGSPTRTIAFGTSLGGMVSAGLVQQHPERFSGALTVAAPGGGAVGTWNQLLDVAFVIQQLIGPESGLQLVHISDPGTPTSGNAGLAMQLLDAAQATPEGRARIALACAMFNIPGWFDVLTAEPAADDYATRQFNQFLWLRYVLAELAFGWARPELEARMGGNPSWNTDVHYGAQLEKSILHDEVVALYAAAGLNLEEDLLRLKSAPRISADPGAVEGLSEGIVFNGELGGVPMLALHTSGDGLVTVQHQHAYRSAVLKAQDSQLLRQLFVHRGGHGLISSAETITAFRALLDRIERGRWGGLEPEVLNAAAAAMGPVYNVVPYGPNLVQVPPAYFAYDPAPFLRPYDLAVREVAQEASGALGADEPRVGVAAARPLSAWPLPYRGGSLQVSFVPDVSAGGRAEVAIYDLSGRRVRQLSGAALAGSRSLLWDGQDAKGIPVGNGVYFLRATDTERSAQLKIVVMR